MKRILSLLPLLFLLALLSTVPESSAPCCAADIPNGGAVSGTSEVAAGTAEVAAAPKIVVFYLHGTARCSNCIEFEKWGKAAIETTFADELKSGRLEWRVHNIDEPEHQHFVEEFQLYTKAIVLGEMKDGKVARWKNLEKIWDLLGDEAAFGKYVAGETRAFLDGK